MGKNGTSNKNGVSIYTLVTVKYFILSEFPKISIITPSYNQGQFIEETIQSVLNQNYPNLEYIIIDGGSKDNTVEIIKKYESSLTYWVSEKDNGQTDAINKGIGKCTGEIITWLNSDDYYEPNALFEMAKAYTESKADFYQADANIVDENGKLKYVMKGMPFGEGRDNIMQVCMPQPASFFTKKSYEKFGPLDEELNFSMDMDFWLKMIGTNATFIKMNVVLTNFREHGTTKTSGGYDAFMDEIIRKYREKRFTDKEKKLIYEKFRKYTIDTHMECMIKNGSIRKHFVYKYFLSQFIKKPFRSVVWLIENYSKKLL